MRLLPILAARTLATIALSAWMLILAGCGFSLRGSTVLSGDLPQLQLNLQQPNSEIAQLLSRALADANVSTLESPEYSADAVIPVLSVGAEQLTVQPVTVTPRARAAQYDIRISLPVSLIRGEATLLGPEEMTVQQVYYENTGNITGTQEEIKIIQGEMRRELVNQLLRRLEAVGS